MGKIREMLRVANPQQKVLVAGYAISGMRPEEWCSLKMKDLQIRSDGHAMIELKPEDTKSKYHRQAYITAEVVQWIHEFHATLLKGTEWIFPGYKVHKPTCIHFNGYVTSKWKEECDCPVDHLDRDWVRQTLKKLFEAVGLKDTKEEASDGTTRTKTYTTHSFKTVADDLMGEAGLRDKYIHLICAHKSALGAAEAYKDWSDGDRIGEVEKAWVAIADKLVFFKKIEIVNPTDATVKALEARIAKIENAAKQGADNEAILKLIRESGYMPSVIAAIKKALQAQKRLEDKPADTQQAGDADTQPAESEQA
jgi:integrase